MTIADCATWECVNSFSNWLSAVGTVLTAALALWLSVRDRRVNLAADISLGLVPGPNPKILDQRVFVLEYTNNGPRTVIVTNHSWRLPFVRGAVLLFPNMDSSVAHLCSTLPQELTDGKSGHSFYLEDHFAKLKPPESMFFHSMPIRLTPKTLPVVVTARPGQTNPPQRRTHRRSAL